MLVPSLRSFWWLSVCLGGLPAQSFDDLLGQAETKLRAKDAAGALPLLDAALARDGQRWDGHYVKAVALLTLGRPGEAVQAAEVAMSMVPAEHKAVVERLLARARGTSGTPTPSGPAADLLREAEAAQREGMRALAAKKFAAAFAADPAQARAGLKAASLFFLLEEHGEASRLLRRLRDASDEGVRNESAQMLDQLRRAVGGDLLKNLELARQAVSVNDTAAANAALDAVDALWAEEPEAMLLRCKLAVRQGQPAAALQHLRAAVAGGLDRIDTLRTDADLAALVADESARLWMEQAFGQKLVAALQATVAATANATAAALPAEVPVGQLATGIDLWMVAIQPSTDFVIGSPADEEGRDADEQQRPVPILQAFWIAQTEVTQQQWRAVMNTTPWIGHGYTQLGDDIAATFISWGDAQEFCRRLTEHERVGARLPEGHAYRLPREAEWELACRAGAATAFSFGGDPSQLGDFAVYQGRQRGQYAHAGRQRRPNAFGLFDLHGNVAEWCEDNSGPTMRVVRGGSWRDPAQYCRSANRLRYEADSRYNDLGFRPVLALVESR